MFITGASRGIGKAIALKAAKDGANVVIAAKTTESHPKLPGTIYTAAEEVEKAGGKCLPCKVDIRNEEEVESAVEQCVKKFGSLDVLVNNASAISLTGTTETPIKKFDLMHQINCRGTYLVSQKCIPHLKKSKNAHILNLSPPLNMKPIWFANHVAYTMAKYGMSMCVLGMAAEFKASNVAVNALWPRTAIWTAAMSNVLGDQSVRPKCRKPEVVADAAYAILTRNALQCTGNFFIDEEVLKREGVTDLDGYKEVPDSKEALMIDFFLPEAEAFYAQVLEEQEKSHSTKPGATLTGGAAVAEMFAKIQPLLNEELTKSINAVYKFQLTGSEPGTWFLDLRSGHTNSYGSGEPPSGNPDVVFNCDSEKLVAMFAGKLKPTLAFMTGQLKIQGHLGLAMKLEKLMGRMRSKL